MNRRSFIQTIVALTVLAADQASKWVFLNHSTSLFEKQISWMSFRLMATVNTELAFSISAPRSLFLPIIIVLFAVLLCFWAREVAMNRPHVLWLTFVVGGAAGNLLDRFMHGGVVDWLEIMLGSWSWSSLNLADIMIVVGVLGYLFTLPKRNRLPLEAPKK